MRIALLIGASCGLDSDTLVGANVRVPAGNWSVICEGEYQNVGITDAKGAFYFSAEHVFPLPEPTTLHVIVTHAKMASIYLESA